MDLIEHSHIEYCDPSYLYKYHKANLITLIPAVERGFCLFTNAVARTFGIIHGSGCRIHQILCVANTLSTLKVSDVSHPTPKQGYSSRHPELLFLATVDRCGLVTGRCSMITKLAKNQG